MRQVLIAVLLILELWYGVLFLRAALGGQLDFVAYYRAGGEIIHQENIYKLDRHAPFIHPAFEALAFVPFAILNYKTAYLTFIVINLLLLWWSLRMVGASWEIVAFSPLTIAVVFGQDSIILMALLATSYVALKKNDPFCAGIWLGSCVFRFQNILPIILLCLIWREWKLIKGFATTAGVLALLSCLLVNPFTYLGALKSIAYEQPIERMVNLRGLLGKFPSWVVVLAAVLIVGVAAHTGSKSSRETRMCIAIAAAALVSFHFFAHDLVMLVVPIAHLKSQRFLLIACASSVLALFNTGIHLLALLSIGVIGAFILLQRERNVAWQASSHV